MPDDDNTAGCLCGRIRLGLAGAPVTVMQCHCTDCQKTSGGGAVLVALMPRSCVTVMAGTTASFAVAGTSGETVRRHFCPDCGTPLYSELGKYPDLLALRSGIWDTDPGFAADCAIWTGSAPAWHRIPDDIPRFAGARP